MKNNYIVQNGCHDCTYCFTVSEYDEYDDLPAHYCTCGAPKRPPCGSVLMREEFGGRKAAAKWAKWDKWAKGREVHLAGKCDRWVAR